MEAVPKRGTPSLAPTRSGKVKLGGDYARRSIARAWRRQSPCDGSALEGSSLARCGGGGGGVSSGGVRWSEFAAGSGNVEELEGGAGPLGAADGSHGGRRASEAAAGPAGRCHMTAPSGAPSLLRSPRAWRAAGLQGRLRVSDFSATRPQARAEASGQGCSPEVGRW